MTTTFNLDKDDLLTLKCYLLKTEEVSLNSIINPVYVQFTASVVWGSIYNRLKYSEL